MNVSMEFLSNEPIENTITSIKYKIDKVVFFGHFETIQKNKKRTYEFLKKYCGVKEVTFRPVSETDLIAVKKIIANEVLKEKNLGNKVFFDITGGDNIILVAFGMISNELKTPMHYFDIDKNRFVKLTDEVNECIIMNTSENKIEFNLDQYIKMQGGIINEKLQKKCKMEETQEFINDIESMWDILINNVEEWNGFSGLIRKCKIENEGIGFCMQTDRLVGTLKKNGKNLNSRQSLDSFLKKLYKSQIIKNLKFDNNEYCFTFKNMRVKDCILDAGSVLEIKTYWNEKNKPECTDCRIGVHLDWDGIIYKEPSEDVLNEIDVLTLCGNTPTFISCKNGRVTQESLYELETIANRFAGKYGKKKLVTSIKPPEAILLRAEEMGIEVFSYEKRSKTD